MGGFKEMMIHDLGVSSENEPLPEGDPTQGIMYFSL